MRFSIQSIGIVSRVVWSCLISFLVEGSGLLVFVTAALREMLMVSSSGEVRCHLRHELGSSVLCAGVAGFQSRQPACYSLRLLSSEVSLHLNLKPPPAYSSRLTSTNKICYS